MPTPYESARLNLELFKLRREPSTSRTSCSPRRMPRRSWNGAATPPWR